METVFYLVMLFALFALIVQVVNSFKDHNAWLDFLKDIQMKITDFKIKEIEYKHNKKENDEE